MTITAKSMSTEEVCNKISVIKKFHTTEHLRVEDADIVILSLIAFERNLVYSKEFNLMNFKDKQVILTYFESFEICRGFNNTNIISIRNNPSLLNISKIITDLGNYINQMQIITMSLDYVIDYIKEFLGDEYIQLGDIIETYYKIDYID